MEKVNDQAHVKTFILLTNIVFGQELIRTTFKEKKAISAKVHLWGRTSWHVDPSLPKGLPCPVSQRCAFEVGSQRLVGFLNSP